MTPYDEEGDKAVNRRDGRNGNDRTIGIRMLVGAALGIAYASVFGNLYAVSYGVGLGSVVGLALHYFGGRP